MENLKTWLAPLLESKGCSLYDLEWDTSFKPPVLRVMIDRNDGPIDLDICEACSEAISEKLDQTDDIKGEYMLEVCSPGAERELKTEQQIADQLGKYVTVQLKQSVDQANELTGKLESLDDDQLVLSYFIKGRPKKSTVSRSNIALIRSAVKL